MASSAASPGSLPHGAAGFATTHWSLVLAAGDPASPQAHEALATLCQTYWYPLYAYIRRQGHDADQAQDLTQEFFARLLEKDFLAQIDRERGRFRAFLLAACKHFLANERDRARAQKRGGGRQHLSLDLRVAEDRYRLEPAHTATPDRLFERRWALTLLAQVLAQLRAEFADADRGPRFDRLKAFLTGEKAESSYQQTAKELGMTVGAVKVAVHRLRGRYRELLREEIARTTNARDDVDEEIRHLFTAIES
jgi:RNA polymerase sigma-70 factor (ECF subfamily)